MTILEAYATLGLEPTAATPDIVRATFRRLVLTSHPDVFQDAAEKQRAHERFVRLRLAFEMLRDAGFPRPASSEAPGAAWENAQRGESRKSDTEWRAQPDAGDAAFDSWARELGIGADYAKEMLQHGAPIAIVKVLYVGAGGAVCGAALLAWGGFGLVTEGFDVRGLLLGGFGLLMLIGGLGYMVSPIVYYARRKKKVETEQLSGAGVSSWPHPERLPDPLRWLLVVPTMIVWKRPFRIDPFSASRI